MSPTPPRLPILETERLRLEPLIAGDAQHIFPMMADPQVMAFWDVAEIDEPDVVAQVVAGQVDEMARGRAFHWAIRTLADGAFVGTCDLSDVDRRHKRAEVGFMLDRESWGNGYAQEAMTAVTAYAAANGLRRLLARTQLGNRRSDSLLLKLGFEQEGMLKGYIERDGERRDCRLFGLLL
ncbi:MAG: acetyltransferase, family [Phenylobacterium sp.]|jgi:ribosomal-protein-alanine N-acetyltransferase|nr:acetyltransferase, family [Phenylobacterium sp.]